MVLKQCKECKVFKSKKSYHLDKHGRDGLKATCKACRLKKLKVYCDANREKLREYARNHKEQRYEWLKQDRKLNPKKHKKRQQAYYKTHKKHIEEYYNKYFTSRPGYMAYIRANQTWKNHNRMPKWLTKEHKEEIYQWYRDCAELQWLSEERLVVDHIVPLNGKNVSGLHVPWNLQILTNSENSRKGNKF